MIFFPLKYTAPLDGAYTPVTTLNAVVLPAPFGPMRDTISFLFTSSESEFTATTPPNCMVTSFMVSTFSLISLCPPVQLQPVLRSHKQPRLQKYHCLQKQ